MRGGIINSIGLGVEGGVLGTVFTFGLVDGECAGDGVMNALIKWLNSTVVN